MKTSRFLRAALAAFALAVAAVAGAQTPDAAALHQLSLDSLQQKKTKEAVDYAEKATQADPTKPEYFSQLGVALSARLGEVNFMQMAALSGKMKKAFEKSIELDPKHISGLIGLTRFYLNAPEIAGGSPAKAKTYAERLVAIEPFLGEVELGRVADKEENYPAAAAHFEAALKLKPDNAGVHTLAGRALMKQGKADAARAHFEAALKINPELAAAKKSLEELNAPKP